MIQVPVVALISLIAIALVFFAAVVYLRFKYDGMCDKYAEQSEELTRVKALLKFQRDRARIESYKCKGVLSKRLMQDDKCESIW